MQETRVQSPGLEDALEKEMATHSFILAWEIPWTEEPWGATVHGVTKSQTQLSNYTTITQARGRVLGALVSPRVPRFPAAQSRGPGVFTGPVRSISFPPLFFHPPHPRVCGVGLALPNASEALGWRERGS